MQGTLEAKYASVRGILNGHSIHPMMVASVKRGGSNPVVWRSDRGEFAWNHVLHWTVEVAVYQSE